MSKISAGKDVSDTGMALNDVDKVLTKMGLSLKDQDGIMRDISDVLDEVAAKWNTWNKNQQNQVATAIAGGCARTYRNIWVFIPELSYIGEP